MSPPSRRLAVRWGRITDSSVAVGGAAKTVTSLGKRAYGAAMHSPILLLALLAQAPTDDDAALAQPLTPALVKRLVVARNPALKAAALRVESMRRMAEADGALPAPELMAEALGVPFESPKEAAMASVTLRQAFPAPGVRGAKEEARRASADAEGARQQGMALELERMVGHALVDLRTAHALHVIHQRHEGAAGRVVEVAQARVMSGGAMEDVWMAEREKARLTTLVATEHAAMTRAASVLNGLLARDAEAQLGLPAPAAVETLSGTATAAALLAQARARRPELAEAAAKRTAEEKAREAMDREATVPGFSVRAGYFAPSRMMPMHGFGVSLGVELPWLWGGRRAGAQAQALSADAAALEREDAAYRLGVDVTSGVAAVRAAAAKWKALREVALPAAERAFEGSFASYRSGKGELLKALAAEQAVVEVEVELVDARAMLDHALVDLDWAVAGEAPRETLAAP